MKNDDTEIKTRLSSKSTSISSLSRSSLGAKMSLTLKQRQSLGRNSISFKQVLLEQQYQLPDNYQMRILCLESDIENKKLTSEQFVELLNLYSVC